MLLEWGLQDDNAASETYLAGTGLWSNLLHLTLSDEGVELWKRGNVACHKAYTQNGDVFESLSVQHLDRYCL